MPVNHIYKKTDIYDLQNFLNGAILGVAFPINGFGGLVGTTLNFTSPAVATVTFTPSVLSTNPDATRLFLSDIAAQVRAILPTLNTIAQGGRIGFIEASPTAGVALASTGTANLVLGFSDTENTVGLFYEPPDSAAVPRWTWSSSVNENNHLVATYEAT